MKFISAVLLLVALVGINAISMEQDQKNTRAKKYAAECQEETKIDKEKAKKIDYADFSEVKENDDEAECYVKCFFKKVGFFNEADELQQEVMVKKLAVDEGVKNDKLEALILKCSQKTGENKCQLAYNVYHCYQTQKAEAIKV
ncbi:unnamed protein product [Diamesa serratosioi]